MAIDINDFGFTFEPEKAENTEDFYDVISSLEKFLKNLKGPATQDVIKWPADKRHEQIDIMLKKIEMIKE